MTQRPNVAPAVRRRDVEFAIRYARPLTLDRLTVDKALATLDECEKLMKDFSNKVLTPRQRAGTLSP